MANIEKKIYIHHNFNKNQIKQVLLENSDYDTITTPNPGEDKGLIYFDTSLNRIMVWNGNTWKIVKYLDDRDLTDFSDVLIEDIWIESNLIPATYSIAVTSSVVQFATASTTYVDNSYSFDMNLLTTERTQIVPERYGSIYQPVVKASDGTIIATASYTFQSNRVSFYGGFLTTPAVNPSTPPIVEYWRYTGKVGSYNFIGGATNIIEVSTSSPTINLPTTVFNNNIISVTVNGILIYRYSFNNSTHQLTIDEANLGYTIDSTDLVRVEVNI